MPMTAAAEQQKTRLGTKLKDLTVARDAEI
jgi:hypothetical protein